MLTVSGKTLGRKAPLFADFSVAPPAAAQSEPVRLRDLIGHVVRAEVAAFADRQAERQLVKALTARQVAAGLTAGKVAPGGSDLDQQVDPETAVAAAIQAFEDGLYLVVLDDHELGDLAAPVALAADSRLTFIRLTMLAGG